jgi:diadenosine tetraphosphatase ApaH/serine/threonine PP2A family protein phosphatase
MGIFNFMRAKEAKPAGARGFRAYVVGDIHGRLDLLDELLAGIHRDLAERPTRKALIVFLGDLIDRGPNSAQVVERLRSYRQEAIRTVFLLGNHEEVLLRILGGDASLIPNWLMYGGVECLKSYGIDPRLIGVYPDEKALAIIRLAIPKQHEEFLKTFIDTCRFGDYLFVHAGIRPGVPIDDQVQSDLRWIREPFLTDNSDHGCIVVHGHTISSEVEERPNRIGIDTGAYKTGILTALVVDGTERRYLDTRVSDGVQRK